jgi:hypothetical protein
VHDFAADNSFRFLLLNITSSGVGVFFLRQDDHTGVSKGQMAAAARKGK